MRIGVEHRHIRWKIVGVGDKNAQLGLPFDWEWLNLHPLPHRAGQKQQIINQKLLCI